MAPSWRPRRPDTSCIRRGWPLASRRHAPPAVSDPEQWPAVTVLVAAYAEAECIGPKVRDVLANGYPGPLDVMVVADADVETAARAEHAGATVVTADDRLGKAQAINLGFSKVTSPIVVLTDANNHLAPGAIAALVRHFNDPRVGAVAGEKVEADGGGEDLYWRFESWLKQREWRLGTTIGLVGELAAIRTDAWRPIPSDIATDDLWIALDLSERGYDDRLRAERQGVRAAGAHLPTAMGAPHPQCRRRAARLPAAPLPARARRAGWWRPRSGGTAWRATPCRPWPMSRSCPSRCAGRRSSRVAKLFLLGHVIGAVVVARRAASEYVPRVGADPAERARPPRWRRPAPPVSIAVARGARPWRDAPPHGARPRRVSSGRGPGRDRPVPARRPADALDDGPALKDASVSDNDPDATARPRGELLPPGVGGRARHHGAGRPAGRARHRPHPGLASRGRPRGALAAPRAALRPAWRSRITSGCAPRMPSSRPSPGQFARELATTARSVRMIAARRPGLRPRALQQPLGPPRQCAGRPSGAAPVDHRALRPGASRAGPQGADRGGGAVDQCRRHQPGRRRHHRSPRARSTCASCRLSVDLDRFGPGPVSAPVRRHLTSDEQAPLVGIVGRIDPEKGVDVLVRAMGLLQGAAARRPSGRGGKSPGSLPTAIPSGCGPKPSGIAR